MLKHSHISLACIHDRSARLAAGMGARLRGTLLRLLIGLVYLLIIFLYNSIQFHEGVLNKGTICIEKIVAVACAGCSLLEVVT